MRLYFVHFLKYWSVLQHSVKWTTTNPSLYMNTAVLFCFVLFHNQLIQQQTNTGESSHFKPCLSLSHFHLCYVQACTQLRGAVVDFTSHVLLLNPTNIWENCLNKAAKKKTIVWVFKCFFPVPQGCRKQERSWSLPVICHTNCSSERMNRKRWKTRQGDFPRGVVDVLSAVALLALW